MDSLSGLKTFLITLAIFVLFERLFAARHQKLFRRGLLTDLTFLICNGWLVMTALSGVLAAGVLLAGWIVPASLKETIHDLPYLAQVPLVVLLADLGVYWTHRILHVVPAMWHIHAVHHSVEEIDWLAAVHQHPLDVLFMRSGSLLPITVLGFSTEAIGAYFVLYYWQAYLIHANVRLNYGPLRYLLVSPDFHHWHHSSEQEARDKNFGGIFAFFDLLFGSVYLPKGRKPKVFGVDHPMPSTYLSLVAYPFVSWLSNRSAGLQTADVGSTPPPDLPPPSRASRS